MQGLEQLEADDPLLEDTASPPDKKHHPNVAMGDQLGALAVRLEMLEEKANAVELKSGLEARVELLEGRGTEIMGDQMGALAVRLEVLEGRCDQITSMGGKSNDREVLAESKKLGQGLSDLLERVAILETARASAPSSPTKLRSPSHREAVEGAVALAQHTLRSNPSASVGVGETEGGVAAWQAVGPATPTQMNVHVEQHNAAPNEGTPQADGHGVTVHLVGLEAVQQQAYL